jgi:uncharacterized membrane protein (UPF0127 family)
MRVTGTRARRVTAGLLLAAMAGLAGAAGPAGGQAVSEHGNPWVQVRVGKATVEAEAVESPERLYLGLSYRKELPEGRGMLFIMPETEVQTFCMRGMRLALDFIWIRDGRVAGITPNVPASFPGDVVSPAPASQVLEVPGGFAGRHGIKTGDPVRWQ